MDVDAVDRDDAGVGEDIILRITVDVSVFVA